MYFSLTQSAALSLALLSPKLAKSQKWVQDDSANMIDDSVDQDTLPQGPQLNVTPRRYNGYTECDTVWLFGNCGRFGHQTDNRAPHWNYWMAQIISVAPSLDHDTDYCQDHPCDSRCPLFRTDRLMTGDKRRKRAIYEDMDEDYSSLDANEMSYPGENSDEDLLQTAEINEARNIADHHRKKRSNRDFTNADNGMDALNLTPGIGSEDKLYKGQGCKFPDIEEDDGLPGAFESVTTDCLGNVIPSDQKWWAPKPKFFALDRFPQERSGGQRSEPYDTAEPMYNAYIKDDVRFHFPPGQYTQQEGFAYCESLGMKATHLWCPGSFDELQYVWAYHPEQNMMKAQLGEDLDWSGYANRGLWTGIRRHKLEINENEGTDRSEFYCGTNTTYQWYDQEYFAWASSGRWRLGPNLGKFPQGYAIDPSGGNRGKYITHYKGDVMVAHWVPIMTDECWTGTDTKRAEAWWTRGQIVCEMNCDLVDVDPVKPEDTSCSVDCQDECYRGECICHNCYETVRPDGTCKPISQIEEDIPVDNAIPEILDLLDEEITDEEITELLTHGCHCAKLGGGNAVHLGGANKFDNFDEACNKWNQGRRCLFLPGGQCHGRDVSGQTYRFGIDPAARQDKCTKQPTPEELKAIQDEQEGRIDCWWGYYPDVAIDCSLESDPCLQAICEVDGKWAAALVKAYREHHEVDFDFKTQNDTPWTGTVAGDGDCEICLDCIQPSVCYGTAPELTLGKE